MALLQCIDLMTVMTALRTTSAEQYSVSARSRAVSKRTVQQLRHLQIHYSANHCKRPASHMVLTLLKFAIRVSQLFGSDSTMWLVGCLQRFA